ncbi:MAG: Rnase Y domain-containing protein, partial [Planctomycetota bacterium]
MEYAAFALGGLLVGFLAGRHLYYRFLAAREADAKARTEEILRHGREEADRLVKEARVQARDEVVTRREEFERETEKARAEIRNLEMRITKREETLDGRDADLTQRDKRLSDQEKRLANRQASLAQRSDALDAREKEVGEKLLEVAELSREEAERRVLERVDQELAVESDKLIRRRVEEAKDEAETRSRQIVLTAIQRMGTGHMSDAVVSTVDVPNDEMKGRIIGREGRNIRAFEKATGVD